MNSPREVHQHRFLPSKGCSWACACGVSFVSCICGKCLKPLQKAAPVAEKDKLSCTVHTPPLARVTVRGRRKS